MNLIESGIDVAPGILGKNNKHNPLNKHSPIAPLKITDNYIFLYIAEGKIK